LAISLLSASSDFISTTINDCFVLKLGKAENNAEQEGDCCDCGYATYFDTIIVVLLIGVSKT
jgi:hypothetical protein